MTNPNDPPPTRPPGLRGPIQLRARFQHYAWGDDAFIPRLFGLPNPSSQPYAEAWIGAHPALPAMASVGDGDASAAGHEIPLNRLLAEQREAILGANVRARFRGLPYLVKILAAARPLSIQVHPTRAQAADGFRRENDAGIALDAAQRSYRDDNHKPELILALTPFQALCGFRPADEIAAALARAPEVAELLPPWPTSPGTAGTVSAASLRELVTAYLRMPEERLAPALSRWIRRLRAEAPAAGSAEHWTLEADRTFSRPERPDRGLLFTVLLNLLDLQPGQALFLPAGVPHAYLRGVGVEVMSSSDNVLRAGLTPKHVDAGELLAILSFEMGRYPMVAPRRAPGGELVYDTPAEEFELADLGAGGGGGESGPARGPEVILFLGGQPGASLRIESAQRTLDLTGSGACIIPHGTSYRLTGAAPGRVFRVRVPGGDADARPDPAPTFRGRRPKELAFGTSGMRGLVTDITDLEAYVSTRGFLDYLIGEGDVAPGAPIAVAGDLRPSTDSPERSILRAVARAIRDAGLAVVDCGRIPTPALAAYAFDRGWPSIMVTGSHIPFDRNGIKFYKSRGEVLKPDEAPILRAVARVRRAEYERPADASLFDDDGMFRRSSATTGTTTATAAMALPPVDRQAEEHYLRRYLGFFPPETLAGMRVVVYEHTAVGREILARILRGLGAEVHPLGRSAAFVPIDTEAISAAQMETLAALAKEARASLGAIDAIVSTDGDSDRPLLVGVDQDGRPRFFGGDTLGVVAADYLGADAIAVPITSTDAIELHFADRLKAGTMVCRRTRVGSPWVIAAAPTLPGRRRVGWEANGGFLTFSAIERDGRPLAPLPTRDAALPIIAALHAAKLRRVGLDRLFAELPRRFARSALIDGVPPAAQRALVQRYAVDDPDVAAAVFAGDEVRALGEDGSARVLSPDVALRLRRMRDGLARHFDARRGFGTVVRIDLLDGARMTFDDGDVAHVRVSGNAPQMRIYAVSSTEERADRAIALAVREPDGILHTLVREAEHQDEPR